MYSSLINEQAMVAGAGKDSKVGVEGDSAGGKLAGSVAHDVPGLAFQVSSFLVFINVEGHAII